MKIRYLGETTSYTLDHGGIYEVLSIEEGCFRIIDKSGEDYLYSPELCEVVDFEGQERAEYLGRIRLGWHPHMKPIKSR